MTNDASSSSLLDDLDSRQNQLLDELDELNRRIEQVLQSYLVGTTALSAVSART